MWESFWRVSEAIASEVSTGHLHGYTITGADDWEMTAFSLAIIGGAITVLGGIAWWSLRTMLLSLGKKIEDNREGMRSFCAMRQEEHKQTFNKLEQFVEAVESRGEKSIQQMREDSQRQISMLQSLIEAEKANNRRELDALWKKVDQ